MIILCLSYFILSFTGTKYIQNLHHQISQNQKTKNEIGFI